MGSTRHYIVIIAVLSAMVLGLGGFLAWEMLEGSYEKDLLVQQKDSITVELQMLTTNFDSLETDNDTLKLRLQKSRNEVNSLVQTMKKERSINYAKIAEYRKQVTSFRKILKTYVAQIDELNQKNKELLAENKKVRSQYLGAQQKNQDLDKTNKKLNKQIEKAKTLVLREIDVIAMNRRGKKTIRSRSVTKIAVNFVINKNHLVERGDKVLFLRLMAPGDKLLESVGTTTTFEFEKTMVEASASREVTFEGTDLPVTIYWTVPTSNKFRLRKGKYKAVLYSDGLEIGARDFVLK